METIKNQKQHAGMREILQGWATGIILWVASFIYTLRGLFSEHGVNMGMAITLFILAVLWWRWRIKKEKRDAMNSEIIGRTLLMEEQEVKDRIKKNGVIPKPKAELPSKSKDEEIKGN